MCVAFSNKYFYLSCLPATILASPVTCKPNKYKNVTTVKVCETCLFDRGKSGKNIEIYVSGQTCPTSYPCITWLFPVMYL